MRALTPDDVVVDGYRIACGVHGAGPPVVLVHGTPSFSYIWRNVVPPLTAADRQVHLFDLLGYGNSERPADPAADTSVAGQVDVLLALLDHWDLHDAHIVAHDIGGAVAQRLALFCPSRVRTLTLIDSVSFNSWPSPRTREQMKHGLGHLIKAPDDEHRTQFRVWIQTTVYDPDQLPTEVFDSYVDMIAGPMRQPSFFQHQVAHYDARYTQELTGRLGELGDRPVQLIWGADDRWQVLDWAHKLHAAIPGSQLHVLERCGHFAMEDRPEAIVQRLVDFTTREPA